MSGTDPKAVTGADVRRFYEEMPFNYYGAASDAAESVAANPLTAYPDLDALLKGGTVDRVLEVGCGAGWASNALAAHYGKRVTAVDFTEKALARAAEVAALAGVADKVDFVHGDLFKFDTADRFDLVLSVGVLHHTRDCRAAFNHISRFVKPGGHLFVGLYHHYGRRPFLAMFHQILAAEGEEAAFQRFRSISPDRLDEVHQRSWFRDQVLHPMETQHTLVEVMEWLDDLGFDLRSTSINGYEEIGDPEELAELERDYEAISELRNRTENRFFPGFFTILAQR